MVYDYASPAEDISHIVRAYWLVDSEGDTTEHVQKIIPDGYPELIFHYENPYKIKLAKAWELQSTDLIAGQISKHFYLSNTGKSGMIGIKLQPTGLYQLLGLNMQELTDKVESASNFKHDIFAQLKAVTHNSIPLTSKIAQFDNIFRSIKNPLKSYVQPAIDLIMERSGAVRKEELLKTCHMSERTFERHFLKEIGLSAKMYARVIRMSYIFKSVSEHQNWASMAYDLGYYDQAHFIKEFKAFTGDNPSKYGFDELNMANFFMKKSY